MDLVDDTKQKLIVTKQYRMQYKSQPMIETLEDELF